MRLDQGNFVIASSGFADGPAQALREYLTRHGAGTVTAISHPLVPEGPHHHRVDTWIQGAHQRTQTIRLPFRPPYTYPLDLAVPLHPPAGVDVWFGFNNLACARGLIGRQRGRCQLVVYWCVDFVPARFGRGLITKAYDAVDHYCCAKADWRFELSQAALDARTERHGNGSKPLAPAYVVPMGAWLERVPTTSKGGWRGRRVAYLGHLVERQGVRTLVEALALVKDDLKDLSVDIVGDGPEAADLRTLALRLGLESTIRFHGFIEDHRAIERLLADASLAVAPYVPSPDSFTRYADPGKLKAYLAAGLPIVMTDVPPIARDLAHRGGASLVDASARSLARGIIEALTVPSEWEQRRVAALKMAQEFDWNHVLAQALERIWSSR